MFYIKYSLKKITFLNLNILLIQKENYKHSSRATNTVVIEMVLIITNGILKTTLPILFDFICMEHECKEDCFRNHFASSIYFAREDIKINTNIHRLIISIFKY